MNSQLDVNDPEVKALFQTLLHELGNAQTAEHQSQLNVNHYTDQIRRLNALVGGSLPYARAELRKELQTALFAELFFQLHLKKKVMRLHSRTLALASREEALQLKTSWEQFAETLETLRTELADELRRRLPSVDLQC